MGEVFYNIEERRRVSIIILSVMLTMNFVLFLMDIISSVPFWVTVGIVTLIALQRS